MSNENAVAELTVEAFRRCDWHSVMSSVDSRQSHAVSDAFLSAATRATEGGRLSDGQILHLLGRATSMLLHPDSPNEPFRPLVVFEDQRSPQPEDFSSEEVSFFADVLGEIDDPWLQGRLADLVWLVGSPRDYKAALVAIDAYRQVPLELDGWPSDGFPCRKRAIGLSRMLRSAAGTRPSDIESELLAVFDVAGPSDVASAHLLAELLYESGLGRSKEREIAEKLETFAIDADQAGDRFLAREYFEAAAKWYERSGIEERAAAMTAALAESWAREAEAQLTGDRPSNIIAMAFFENAINTYRRIPARHLPALAVENRINELRAKVSKAGEESTGEMGVIPSPSIDITETVNRARESVRGKPLDEALAAFAYLHRGASWAKLRDETVEMLRNRPLLSLLSAVHISPDGRVVAKHGGTDPDVSDDSEQRKALWPHVVRQYGFEVAFVVQGGIVPALLQLNLEHRITERDLLRIAKVSPVVPPARELFSAKGLAAGFDRDFVTAVHLLVPQVEHMVRWHLKHRGVQTTTYQDGITMEIALGSLLDRVEVTDIFGEDAAFELQAIFTDPIGPNLRNDVAHGLLELDDAESAFAVYAWWWCFRLVYGTFLQAVGRASSSPDSRRTNSDRRGQQGDGEET